jgi:hypothetical protein
LGCLPAVEAGSEKDQEGSDGQHQKEFGTTSPEGPGLFLFQV